MEEPLSTHSASFQHPLSTHWDQQVTTREEGGNKGKTWLNLHRIKGKRQRERDGIPYNEAFGAATLVSRIM